MTGSVRRRASDPGKQKESTHPAIQKPALNETAIPEGWMAQRSANDMNKVQLERYSRQILAPGFGVEAQIQLCSSSVLVVGCGGLGSVVVRAAQTTTHID